MNQHQDRTDTIDGASASPDDALPGDREAAGGPGPVAGARVLGDRYLLEEQIASGGMASVWRAHDEILARTVAVKILHGHLSDDDAFRERFRREAVAAAKLSHPHVVGLFDTGTADGQVYLVMEFVDGSTLSDVIADAGALDIGQACLIGERIARALDYAHDRGLVHRDIKPANILLDADAVVKVADFGIAKAQEEATELTSAGVVMGTAAYVAPEQIMAQPVDGKADQYALGCVLYELLTGRRPFQGGSPVQTAALRLESDPLPPRVLRADVPRALDAVIMRMLAQQPGDRFPSCAAAADELARFADQDPALTAALVTEQTLRVPAPAASPDATGAGPGADSFLRTEGRWLVPVIALLGLGAALIFVGLVTGVLPNTAITSIFAREVTPTPDAAPEADVSTQETVRVPLSSATAFDPEGDGTERDESLPLLFDGAPATVWATERYNTAAFGNLKSGVGFTVDLGAPRQVVRVRLHVATPGIGFELRASDRRSQRVADWEVLTAVTDAEEGWFLYEPEEPVEARHLMVRVTGALQPFEGQFRAEFGELSVEARP